MRFLSNLALAVAVTLAIPAVAAHAQTTSSAAPAAQTTPQAKKGKTVRFTLQNKTSSPVSLTTGDQQVTLAAGQAKSVKASSGTKIVTTAPSAAGQTGTVLAEVSDGMDGATVNLR